jgi:hypothetical protein
MGHLNITNIPTITSVISVAKSISNDCGYLQDSHDNSKSISSRW